MHVDSKVRWVWVLYVVTALGVAASIASAFAASESWKIDPAHTAIGFSIDATGFPTTEGRFTRFDGRIAIDLKAPEKSRIAFHVDAGSVNVGASSFSDYLRSPAFLDVARHPSIDFVSTSVEKANDSTIRVNGELTLLGVTKPLSVDVIVTKLPSNGKLRFGFRAEAEIDRLAFGMNSGFPLIARDVSLRIASEADEL